MDLTPPFLIELYPPDGITITDTLADIIVVINDSIAGVLWSSSFISVGADTFWAGSLLVLGDTLILHPEDFGLTWAGRSSAANGETVTVCSGAADSADYCTGYNFADTCWQFIVDITGITASVLFPYDSVITSCADQGVIWELEGEPTDSSIAVEINGVEYTLDDEELTLNSNRDTLIFTPEIYWENGDTINVCLFRAEDEVGNPLDDTACVHFTVDLMPPVMWGPQPPPDTVINDPSPTIVIHIADSIAGLESGTISITVNEDTVSWGLVTDSLIVDLEAQGISFRGGDTLSVCVVAGDSARLCGANVDTFCWNFSLSAEGPLVTLISPWDGAITACDDQGAIFTLTDPQGIVSTSVWVTANGDTVPPSWLSFDEETLKVQPPVGMWDDGDTIVICAGGEDILGNACDTPACVFFIADLSPPNFSDIIPSDGDTVEQLRPQISLAVSDNISGINDGTLRLTIDGETVLGSWDGTRLSWLQEIELAPASWHTVCAYATDSPDLCYPNADSLCWTFYTLGLANLWIDELSLEPAEVVTEGVSVNFLGSVINDSVRSTGAFEVGVFLDGQLLGTITRDGLSRGETESLEWLIDGLPTGEYQLCFSADNRNVIDESDELDNEACITLIVLGASCNVHPNPFTPNGDGINEEAKFEYPKQGTYSSQTTIKVYDLQNRLVKEISGDIRAWDGKDENGRLMPRGVYVYIVLQQGEVICKGTVYLAR